MAYYRKKSAKSRGVTQRSFHKKLDRISKKKNTVNRKTNKNFNDDGRHEKNIIRKKTPKKRTKTLFSQKRLDQGRSQQKKMRGGQETIDQYIQQINNGETDIDISQKMFNDADAVKLAEALKNNTTVTRLNIGMNPITVLGIEAIAEVLGNTSSTTAVTELILRGNPLYQIGAQPIGKALLSNTTITTLDLSMTMIGPIGAKNIAEALKVNRTLTHLNLSWNKIGDIGAPHIAKALRDNTALKNLNLSHNEIGDEGMFVMAQALMNDNNKYNKTLTTLDLCRNDYSEKALGSFVVVLLKNNSLNSLGLDFPVYSGNENIYSWFEKALETNHSLTELLGMEQNTSSINQLLQRNKEKKKSTTQKVAAVGDIISSLPDFPFTYDLFDALLKRTHQEIFRELNTKKTKKRKREDDE